MVLLQARRRAAEHELSLLRAQQLVNVCEEVTTSAGVKRVMYLTNEQARVLCSAEAAPRILRMLGISEPRLVIKLCSSVAGVPQIEVMGDGATRETMARIMGRGYNFGVPDLDDMVKKERKLEVFLKDVLVPLAAEARALVLIESNPECTLSMAFTRAVQLSRARYGDKLPFITLTSVLVISMHKAILPDAPPNLAREIYSQCERWKERQPLNQALWDAGKLAWPRLMPNPGIDAYILVEGFDEAPVGSDEAPEPAWGPYGQLQETLLNALVGEVPVVAIRTQATLSGFPMDRIVRLLGANVPVLYLDLRDRPHPRELIAAGAKAGEGGDAQLVASAAHDESVTAVRRRHLIMQAVARWREDARAMHAHRATECFDCCSLAYFWDCLYHDGDTSTTARSGGAEGESSAADGVRWLFQATEAAWRRDRSRGSGSATRAVVNEHVHLIVDALVEQGLEDIAFSMSDEDRAACMPDSKPSSLARHPKYRDKVRSDWSSYYSILTSPTFYGAHIEHASGVEQLLHEIVVLDTRLPAHNTLEGLLLLQDAWDVVDICVFTGNRYKIAAKATFVLMLLVTVAITTLTVLRDEIDAGSVGFKGLSRSDMTLFFLSMLLSVLSSIVAFYQPSQRWRRLRSFAQRMEAAIWAYRTRTGDYEERKGHRRRPEQALRAEIAAVRLALVEANQLDRTSFTARYPAHVFTHGQRAAPAQAGGAKVERTSAAGARVAPESAPAEHVDDDGASSGSERAAQAAALAEDDHFSPIRPDVFIQIRVARMVTFFQGRLPRYAQSHASTQVALILSSATGAAMAFLGESRLVAIISAAAAGITAWVEFHAAADKLQRYNSAIIQLENLRTWWNSLGDIERAGSPAITKLVLEAEAVVAGELRAWSSAPAVQLSAGDDDGGDGKAGTESHHNRATEK